jgi:transcription elongation factor SPT5
VDDSASEDNDEEERVNNYDEQQLRKMYSKNNNQWDNLLNLDEDELEQRYQQQSYQYIDQNNESAQVPSLKDPKVFAIKCKIGLEREMALSIGNKFKCLKGQTNELKIISVNALDKIKGTIYIEAMNKFDAEHACEGFRNLDTRFINVRVY